MRHQLNLEQIGKVKPANCFLIFKKDTKKDTSNTKIDVQCALKYEKNFPFLWDEKEKRWQSSAKTIYLETS